MYVVVRVKIHWRYDRRSPLPILYSFFVILLALILSLYFLYVVFTGKAGKKLRTAVADCQVIINHRSSSSSVRYRSYGTLFVANILYWIDKSFDMSRAEMPRLYEF